jgi:signal transduction histidine kinase
MRLYASHDPWLVTLSIAVAIAASYVALDTGGRLRTARGQLRPGWVFGGALAMGLGIWSMHFIGMLAFRLPFPIRYDAGLVVISALVAVLGSGLSLVVVAGPSAAPGVFALAGVLMAAGMCGMHYISMAAMHVPARLTYDLLLVSASVLVAIGASFIALWLSFRLRDQQRHLWRRRKAGGAVIMGAAMAGMHYTGMAASVFLALPGSHTMPHGLTLENEILWALIGGAAVVLAIAVATAVPDARLMREETLRHSAEAAQAAAEEANYLKDQFLALLSHELRTPLNVVLGWTQMLRRRDDLPEEVQRGLEIVERNARTQVRLVDDMLDLQGLVLGHLRFEARPLDLATLVTTSVEDLRPTAQAHGLTLTVDARPAIVSADCARLRQVTHNLLSNAIKFTPKGGSVHVEVALEDGFARMIVTDTGQGMPEAFVPHAFEPFRQAEPNRTRRHGGLGLGLSIVRRLVEEHGGRVGVRSAVGQGTAFIVELPLAVPDAGSVYGGLDVA